jgi:hypothetical protein
MRPMIKQAIVKNRSRMGGVYEQLVRSGIVTHAEA